MRRDVSFDWAAAALATQVDYGPLLWAVGGRRCYARTVDGALTMTLLSPNAPTLVYIVEGVDLDRLR